PPRCRQLPPSQGSTIAASLHRAAARRRRSASSRPSSSRRGCPPSAARAARSTTLPVALAVDAQRRPGQRLEALDGDRPIAIRASPARAFLDPLQRGVDLPEDVPGVLFERLVEFAVVG